jgi:hypothetical protein
MWKIGFYCGISAPKNVRSNRYFSEFPVQIQLARPNVGEVRGCVDSKGMISYIFLFYSSGGRKSEFKT